jgi:hypothetical protein
MFNLLHIKLIKTGISLETVTISSESGSISSLAVHSVLNNLNEKKEFK